MHNEISNQWLRGSVLSAVFLFTLFLKPTPGVAQDTLSTLPHDSSTIEVRTADQQFLNELTNEEVFDYQETARNSETFWSRIQRWLFQSIISLLENKWASFFIKLIFFGIFGFVLVALLNQILGGNIQSAFSTKKSSKSLSLKTSEISLKEDDLKKMLQEALSENKYSDAVRIIYLQALQELNGMDLISLKPDKTNHDYLQELGSHSTASSFSRLTFFYEYVEYGDFKIDKTGFEKVLHIYQQLKERLTR